MKRPKIESFYDTEKKVVVEQLPEFVLHANYGRVGFYGGIEESSKELHGFIRKVEMLVRKSPEMRYYIQYLKDELDLGHCYFYKNLTTEDTSIELHHYPFSLYDVCEIVVKKAILDTTSNTFFSTFKLAEVVVSLHYQKMIGLVPLTVTLHQLAHDGNLFIPMGAVYGDVRKFVKMYRGYISSSLIETLEGILTATPSQAEAVNIKLRENIQYKYKKDHELVSKEIKMLLGSEQDEQAPSKT